MLSSQLIVTSQVSRNNLLHQSSIQSSSTMFRHFNILPKQSSIALQTRAFRFGIWPSYPDQKDIHRRHRAMRQKYIEAVNRKICGDQLSSLAGGKHTSLKGYLLNAWHISQTRLGGRYISISHVSLKTNKRRSQVQPADQAEQKSFDAEPRVAGQTARDSKSLDSQGKTNKPEPEFMIDPITNRKVFKKVSKSSWSNDNNCLRDAPDSCPPFQQFASMYCKPSAEELDYYGKPFTWNEPDGLGQALETESLAKALAAHERELAYKPFFNPKTAEYAEIDPVQKGLADFDQKISYDPFYDQEPSGKLPEVSAMGSNGLEAYDSSVSYDMRAEASGQKKPFWYSHEVKPKENADSLHASNSRAAPSTVNNDNKEAARETTARRTLLETEFKNTQASIAATDKLNSSIIDDIRKRYVQPKKDLTSANDKADAESFAQNENQMTGSFVRDLPEELEAKWTSNKNGGLKSHPTSSTINNSYGFDILCEKEESPSENDYINRTAPSESYPRRPNTSRLETSIDRERSMLSDKKKQPIKLELDSYSTVPQGLEVSFAEEPEDFVAPLSQADKDIIRFQLEADPYSKVPQGLETSFAEEPEDFVPPLSMADQELLRLRAEADPYSKEPQGLETSFAEEPKDFVAPLSKSDEQLIKLEAERDPYSKEPQGLQTSFSEEPDDFFSPLSQADKEILRARADVDPYSKVPQGLETSFAEESADLELNAVPPNRVSKSKVDRIPLPSIKKPEKAARHVFSAEELARLELERDPYSKEPQGLEISYAEEDKNFVPPLSKRDEELIKLDAERDPYSKVPQGLEISFAEEDKNFVAPLSKADEQILKLESLRDPYSKVPQGLETAFAEEDTNFVSPLSKADKELLKARAESDPYSTIPQGLETSYAEECITGYEEVADEASAMLTKLQAEIDPYSKEPQGLQTSYAEECDREGTQRFPVRVCSIGSFNKDAQTTKKTQFSRKTKVSRPIKRKQTSYKVLAYDAVTKSISVAKTTSSVAGAPTPLTPSEVLLRLNNPSKFLPYFKSLRAEGYEIASGSDDVLIFRKVQNDLPSSNSTLKTLPSQKPLTNPIDGMQTPRTATSNFASPTGFVNHDLPRGIKESFKPNINIRREEPVFSGRPKWQDETKGKKTKRGTFKTLVLGAAWVGGCSYAIGVVAEYF